jgi:hypothetical protein
MVFWILQPAMNQKGGGTKITTGCTDDSPNIIPYTRFKDGEGKLPDLKAVFPAVSLNQGMACFPNLHGYSVRQFLAIIHAGHAGQWALLQYCLE